MQKNDEYVRENWVGYRVVVRYQRVHSEEIHAMESMSPGPMRSSDSSPTSGEGLSIGDLSKRWSGPFTVEAETTDHWIVRNEEGIEKLIRKDEFVFLSVGEEKA